MTIPSAVSQAALDAYFDGIGRLLGRKERRANFALYALGLLSPLERKSVEPIAALSAGHDPQVSAKLHDHLLHFTSVSPWSDEEVRSYAADYALRALLEHEEMDVWIVDDTGLLKKGDQSVGVQRQYTGTAGKVTNCQVAVSLTVATRSQHLPLEVELYVPEAWAKDKARRKEAKIPADVAFRTKPEMALDQIARWLLEDVPAGTVCADAGYGHDGKFRGGLTQLGLSYAVGVMGTLGVHRVTTQGREAEESLEQVAFALSRGAYRNVTWAEGTRRSMQSRFAWVRVQVARPDAAEPAEQGLLIEWPSEEKKPTKYTLVTLPADTPLEEVVRQTKARWRVEKSYEEMKGELGFDHFEGRSWRGWNHHMSIVLACYALVIACKRRAFPPSAGRTAARGENERADGAALLRLVRDGAPNAAGDRPQVVACLLRAQAPRGQDAAGLQAQAAVRLLRARNELPAVVLVPLAPIPANTSAERY